MALGCRIRRNFERPSKELVEAFRRIPVANIDDNCGKIAAVDSSIFPLNPKARLLGTAFTVNAPAGDNLLFHKALDMAPAGRCYRSCKQRKQDGVILINNSRGQLVV